MPTCPIRWPNVAWNRGGGGGGYRGGGSSRGTRFGSKGESEFKRLTGLFPGKKPGNYFGVLRPDDFEVLRGCMKDVIAAGEAKALGFSLWENDRGQGPPFSLSTVVVEARQGNGDGGAPRTRRIEQEPAPKREAQDPRGDEL